LQLLAGKGSVAIVGDVDQSIFSFRHANPEGISDYGVRYPETHDEVLNKCRRCPRSVVAIAAHLIAHNHPAGPARLTPLATNPAGSVHIVQWDSVEAEAQGIADYVRGLIDSNCGITAKDILVLTPRRLLGYKLREVIVTRSLPAALAAKAATATIPIVFTSGDDPVKAGLVASINRPGGNVTGVSQFTTLLAAKRLDLLRRLLPTAATASLLLDPNNPTAETELADFRDAVQKSGLEPQVLNASADQEIELAFVTLGEQQSDVLLVGAGPFLNSRRFKLAELAARYGIPAIYPYKHFVTAGGLLSYGSVTTESYQLAGMYAGRILKGEKPGDLPVIQPTKFELVLNVKAAKAIGLTIPDEILTIADEVIE
jgi:putative ABC transport system substrate-binding protein